MEHATFIGIDPGCHGGIAVLTGDNLDTLDLSKVTDADVADFMRCHRDFAESVAYAILENPTGSVMAQRGRAISVSAVVKLGSKYGFMVGLLTGLGIRFDERRPQQWQAAMGVTRTNKDESDTAKKNRHKQAAQRLFPGAKITHAVADAILIAEFAKREWARMYSVA